jgi:hypothetical protein
MYSSLDYLLIQEIIKQIGEVKAREHKQELPSQGRLTGWAHWWLEHQTQTIEDDCLPLQPSQANPNA